MQRPVIRIGGHNLGLALSGGGLKGVAHIGVLQVLEEYGIYPQMVAGTSAGSIFAGLYAAGVSPQKMATFAQNLRQQDVMDWGFGFGSAFWLALKGLCPRCGLVQRLSPEGFIRGKRLEKIVEQLTSGKTLRQAAIPLAIISTDIDSGERIVFSNWRYAPPKTTRGTYFIQNAPIHTAIRSSIAIPGVFQPVHYQERTLVDGGLVDNVPVSILRWMGANPIIAVDVGTHHDDQKVQGIINILMRSLDVLIRETSKDELERYADLVLQPKVGKMGLGDVEKIPACIESGAISARKAIPAIQKILLDGEGVQKEPFGYLEHTM